MQAELEHNASNAARAQQAHKRVEENHSAALSLSGHYATLAQHYAAEHERTRINRQTCAKDAAAATAKRLLQQAAAKRRDAAALQQQLDASHDSVPHTRASGAADADARSYAAALHARLQVRAGTAVPVYPTASAGVECSIRSDGNACTACRVRLPCTFVLLAGHT